jgi:hypothetical protein
MRSKLLQFIIIISDFVRQALIGMLLKTSRISPDTKFTVFVSRFGIVLCKRLTLKCVSLVNWMSPTHISTHKIITGPNSIKAIASWDTNTQGKVFRYKNLWRSLPLCCGKQAFLDHSPTPWSVIYNFMHRRSYFAHWNCLIALQAKLIRTIFAKLPAPLL